MAAIKERPILFSARMVRAILEGRKTVTRRAVKGFQIPTEDTAIPVGDRQRWSAIGQRDPRYGFCVFGSTEQECAKELEEYAPCPYGRRGDRLWVRETWGLQVRNYGGGTGEHIVYRATNPDAIYCKSAEGQVYPVKWKPSIHMHRHSSRILLEITDVRVERLQDISGDQAEAEGVDAAMCQQFLETSPSRHQCKEAVIHGFAGLWQSTGGDWNANPWVWVVEFKRMTP
ncbi:hypothetical protein QMK50_23630 [Pseudomonas sp. P5_152]|uniref:hypothetical protein n=1 Tax=Pseudomonas sp. P5_152 TaxID=3043442 RepID=UPI002A368AAC|nr:hypothetical protein [Pseudomonas sp. P5_152]MDX9667948.1 hypothetical protein [Pseudomonas sp. P5_152]